LAFSNGTPAIVKGFVLQQPLRQFSHSPEIMPVISPKKPYRVGRSKTGLGLFATKPIKKGTKIIRYFGPLLDAKKKKHDAIENKYLFELNNRWTIDGSVRENIARYINHACKPNAESDVRPRKRKVFIRAIKNIAPGEEINYDYGTDYFKAYLKPVGCKCDACERKRAKKRAEERQERKRLKAKAEKKAERKAEKKAAKKAKGAANEKRSRKTKAKSAKTAKAKSANKVGLKKNARRPIDARRAGSGAVVASRESKAVKPVSRPAVAHSQPMVSATSGSPMAMPVAAAPANEPAQGQF